MVRGFWVIASSLDDIVALPDGIGVTTPAPTPDDFYRAYAKAMLSWQHVESALFRVYYGLFENGNYTQAGAAYYSLESFGPKLRLVDATAGAVLKDAQLMSWKSLCEEVRAASGDRNVLAHLPLAVIVNADHSLSLVMSRHVHIPPSLIRKRKTIYDTATCEQLADHFQNLGRQLDAFCDEHF